MFAERLKELRLDRKLRQVDVADALGFTSQAISYYESGQREPRIQELIALAEYFDVSIDYLIGRNTRNQNITK